MRISYYILFVFLLSVVTGCQSMGNTRRMQAFSYQDSEAGWIRNGEPIEFEGEQWFPTDNVEVFLDSEVFVLGEYRGVQFFVDKLDVRPYARLYTKFSKNTFRSYERKRPHDPR